MIGTARIFLFHCDVHRAGYRRWIHFLRQWYLHGPILMDPDTRAAVDAGGTTCCKRDHHAIADEPNLIPDVQPITDPRDMADQGIWMRWEAFARQAGWRYPEKVFACALLHDWYYPRTANYPNWTLPPDHIHLGIEHYSKQDVLAPYWMVLSAAAKRIARDVIRS